MEPDIYESVIVYKKDTKEVVAMIPLKMGKTPIIHQDFDAKIILDTEKVIHREKSGKVIYKEGKKNGYRAGC